MLNSNVMIRFPASAHSNGSVASSLITHWIALGSAGTVAGRAVTWSGAIHVLLHSQFNIDTYTCKRSAEYLHETTHETPAMQYHIQSQQSPYGPTMLVSVPFHRWRESSRPKPPTTTLPLHGCVLRRYLANSSRCLSTIITSSRSSLPSYSLPRTKHVDAL